VARDREILLTQDAWEELIESGKELFGGKASKGAPEESSPEVKENEGSV